MALTAATEIYSGRNSLAHAGAVWTTWMLIESCVDADVQAWAAGHSETFSIVASARPDRRLRRARRGAALVDALRRRANPRRSFSPVSTFAPRHAGANAVSRSQSFRRIMASMLHGPPPAKAM